MIYDIHENYETPTALLAASRGVCGGSLLQLFESALLKEIWLGASKSFGGRYAGRWQCGIEVCQVGRLPTSDSDQPPRRESESTRGIRHSGRNRNEKARATKRRRASRTFRRS